MERIDAIYARQSVDRADSISIESQIEFCAFETRGAEYRVFADRGFSGKNTHRPELQRLLQEIKNGHIRRVICYKLDRCSRSILDFTTLMEFLRSHDVEFVSCTEKFDTASPMGRAMLSICIVFAQLERETIQQRVYDAYHARCRQGFYMGGRIPFGYRLTAHVLRGKRTACYEPEPKEVAILSLLYELYADPDVSLADVAESMKNRGISNPRRPDGIWIRSHIGRMLRNPIYVKADAAVYDYFMEQKVPIQNLAEDFIGTNGCYLYNDRTIGTKLLVLAPHQGIVDAQTWLACRQKAQSKQYDKTGAIKYTWLSGKIKCGKCGYAMIARKQKSGAYLVCSMHRECHARCEGVGRLDVQKAESAVLSQLESQFKSLSQLCSTTEEASNDLLTGYGKLTPDVTSGGMDLISAWYSLSMDNKRKMASIIIEKILILGDRIEIWWLL